MELFVFSISHENTLLDIRESLSFTKRRQAELLEQIKRNIADEAVIVSTCGRFEIYAYAENKDGICSLIKALGSDDALSHAKVYEGMDCVNHLMLTAAGLKSAILGEDQILGQVRDAHELAMAHKAAGKHLNTLFRLAVTGAKRVKTDTMLSKTPVSAATIAVRLCREYLGTLQNKNILIIGASGKTGGSVLKNLLSIDEAKLYATKRSRGKNAQFPDGAELIGYEDRYKLLDICDAVISATLSPHLTLTADGISASLKTKKPRIFMDLAVPRDIETAENELTVYKNIDDISGIADNNERIKLDEAEKAKEILKEYEERYMHWKSVSEGME